MRLITVSLAGLLVLGAAAQAAAQMPTPVLQFDGAEQYEVGGKPWVRYKLSVVNRGSYSADLFTPAPYLPPCGKNTNASRAWVDIFDGQGPYGRLYGFCGLSSSEDLGKLWFALPKDRKPPSSVYIALTDRLSDRRVKETVMSNHVAIGEPWLADVGAGAIDCTRAVAIDELAICNSEDLRTMDGELDRAYRAARVRWTASMSDSVKVMHEDWIKERRACGADQACLMARMVAQIEALDKIRPERPTWILEKAKPSK